MRCFPGTRGLRVRVVVSAAALALAGVIACDKRESPPPGTSPATQVDAPATHEPAPGPVPAPPAEPAPPAPALEPGEAAATPPAEPAQAPGTPAVSAAALADVVARFIRDRMVPASVAFVVPASLRRGEAADVALRLAPETVTPQQLEQELRSEVADAGGSDAALVAMAPRMIASLTCDRPCDIVLTNPPADRAVTFTGRTTWYWAVTPTRATGDTLQLTASLVAPVTVEGRETSYSIGVYRKRLQVRVTYVDRLEDLLGWVREHWAPVTAIGSTLAAACGWLWRRRKPPGHRAGFSAPR